MSSVFLSFSKIFVLTVPLFRRKCSYKDTLCSLDRSDGPYISVINIYSNFIPHCMPLLFIANGLNVRFSWWWPIAGQTSIRLEMIFASPVAQTPEISPTTFGFASLRKQGNIIELVLLKLVVSSLANGLFAILNAARDSGLYEVSQHQERGLEQAVRYLAWLYSMMSWAGDISGI